jgi:hypothetical protein
MLAGFVGCAARILPLIFDGLLVNQVEELAEILAPQFSP